MSLHMITHAVMFAVIATLMKKYLQLLYQMHDLEDECFYKNLKGQSENDSTINHQTQKNGHIVTSGTCFGQHKVCHFQNICFHPDEDTFVYFYSKGDNSVKYFPTLNDVPLSTPKDFNGHNMQVTFIPENMTRNFSVKWIHENSYIFTRFKADNLMHVLHDDILPLFFTMKNVENLKSNLDNFNKKINGQLIFMDDWIAGDYTILYNMFTFKEPLHKQNLIEKIKNAETEQRRNLICFSIATVGLLQDTLWYNYGFTEPQGPIDESSLNAQDIIDFKNFVFNRLSISLCIDCQSDYIVLVSRKENRKILNENDLVEKIAQKFSMKVVTIGSETHTAEKMISLVANSAGMIGMHGSLLSLLMFLKPGSFVVEIFPYAVSANQYTPFKTLANLEGMNLVYHSLETLDSKASVGHPEYIREHGGLGHLSEKEQRKIISQITVPPLLCCEDPSWLYHIYQDTTVDIPSVIDLIQGALDKGRRVRTLNEIHTPTHIKTLQCQISKTGQCHMYISWQEPWNLGFLHHEKLHYEVILQENDSDSSVMYVTDKQVLEINNNIDCDRVSYTVWVRPVFEDYIYGKHVNIDCL